MRTMRKPFVSSLKEEERAPADRSREGRGYRGMNQPEQGFRAKTLVFADACKKY